MKIRRYTYDTTGCETGCDVDELVEHSDGEFVSFTQHEEAVREMKLELKESFTNFHKQAVQMSELIELVQLLVNQVKRVTDRVIGK